MSVASPETTHHDRILSSLMETGFHSCHSQQVLIHFALLPRMPEMGRKQVFISIQKAVSASGEGLVLCYGVKSHLPLCVFLFCEATSALM